MKKNMGINLPEIVRQYVGEDLMSVFETAMEFMPYVNKVLQIRKLNRAERRIKEHIEQLKRIEALLASSNMAMDFIQEKVGPIVLSDLIEDHEDAKITYLLTGFENVFINEYTNESLIINYFDTLRELRYEDIRTLFYYAGIAENNFSDIEDGSEREGLAQYIYAKLERMYLIKSAPTWEVLEKGPEAKEEAKQPTLTKYGKKFVEFIWIDFDSKDYEEKIEKNIKISDKDKVSNAPIARFR